MKKGQIILIIIGTLILIGFISSFSYWLGKESVEVKSEIVAPNSLESKVIKNWFATGEITKISDHILTLTNEGDTLDILIKKDVKIDRLVTPEKRKGIPQVESGIKFKEIKVGDRVDISGKLKVDGSFEGENITIFGK